jgi:exodeoxyribonuclease V alpha subunit
VVGETESLSGTIASVLFRNEENGYTVCRVAVPGRSEPIVVVGACAAAWIGEAMKADGRWTRHPQFGLQFQADVITCIAPTSARGIERFLASGLIRGVGKVVAERLVAHFGKETLNVIEKESARLEEVEGIGPVRRRMIKDSWIEQKAVRDIMIFLQGHEIGAAQATRIHRQYGSQAVALITENPYRLCRDIWGIGFKTADKVASSLEIPHDSPLRAQAGLVHVLQTMTEEGHCFSNETELLGQANALLGIDEDQLRPSLDRIIDLRYLVRDGSRIYITGLYDAERGVADRLRHIRDTPVPFRMILSDKALPWAEERMKLRFETTQADALRMALTEKVSIITGGPGVGKTTIIRALVDVFEARKLRVALAAPTGRAAKRMEEATHREAKTLHRMLKYMPTTGRFEQDRDVPLEADVFIVDEVSMVDIPLMHAFLNAVPDASCLVFVGDTDQLPSVGPGNVLHDMITSDVIACRKLKTIFRQETGGWIVRNAHNVNRGEPLELPGAGDVSDFYFMEAQEPEDVIQKLLTLVTDRIPKRFGFDPMNDVQVLTPMRRNQLGADNLNAILQGALNPSGAEIHRMGRVYRVGDRVMQVRNNYDKDVFNGDIGRIRSLDKELHQVKVDFDGRLVDYDLADLDELVHAYACSIHKSQGSEYPAVVILMTTQHFKMLQRNLLYTGITRGRRLVCLVGSMKAVYIATRNNEIRMRRTALAERLAAVS